MIVPSSQFCAVCQTVNTTNAPGWVVLTRGGTPHPAIQLTPRAPLAFCPACAATTTIDKIPTLRKTILLSHG